MIKRCNDFGAGGVSVAIGELADGLEIDLNAVPKKYEGLDGTELAISESQERMAVVVEKKDVDAFLKLANDENLQASQVAVVKAEPRLVMKWNGRKIVDISRDFLNSNGADKHIKVATAPMQSYEKKITGDFAGNLEALAGDLNICSKRGLSERFDSTIGAGTVLMPFGGKNQLTPVQAMVQKISVEKKHTDTCSLMAFGYNPFITEKSPYHGAYLAVIESVSKLIASGAKFEDVYLTFQEYFEHPGKDPARWGQPLAALLGAFKAQMQLGIASVGGKDSMSGTFEDIHVPPTLVSFAVGMVDARNVVSTDLKGAEGHQLALLTLPVDDALVPEYDKALMLYESLHQAILRGDVLSAHTVGRGGIAAAVTMMAMGSRIGVKLTDVAEEELFLPAYGGIVVELKPGAPVPAGLREIGVTTESATLSACGMTLSLSEAHGAWSEPLESVFPTDAKAKHTTAPFIPYETRSAARPKLQIAKPRVFIPSFPGTNCELDSEKAFRRAGAETDVFVFRNLTAKGIEESVEALVRGINAAQIVMLPGGFSAGDEPDGSGKFIATALRNPRIMEAIMNLLNQRDGLMLGICNGFQALIKLGLVPYGEIRTIREDDPTLTYNTIGRHAATHVRTVVSSVKSPWMAGVNVGDVHQVAISHGEGRFVCREAQLKQLVANGQIVTQYCTIDGVPAVKMPENPNGSYWAVEGICSPDGRVLGKMGHSERIGANVARNIPGEKDQKIFESGVAYFG